MMNSAKTSGSRLPHRICAAALAIAWLGPMNATAQTSSSSPVKPSDFTGDLRSLPAAALEHRQNPPRSDRDGGTQGTPLPPGPPDPIWQKQAGTGTPSPFTTATINADGFSTGARPPDANGAVGPNRFVEVLNGGGSSFGVWDKSGNLLSGPTTFGTLWASAPGDDDCKNRGRGDPVVLYDHLADRWVLSQLANHTTNSGDPLQTWCIAVSKTGNPVSGGWNAYTFFLGVKNDYVKLGLWPDGYYGVSQRGYDGTSSLDVWVFDRANMLNGNPATFQHPSFPVSEHDVITLPGDLNGVGPPPGTPNYYARPYDGNLYSDGVPRLEVFEFHTDWGNPAATSFTLTQTLIPATFRSDLCAGNSLNQNCVPQPNETNKLDGLSTWPMGPLQYRNFGDHESLVFDHSVNADGSGLAGMRWYELRRTPPGSGSWVIQQQGTFAPTDSPTTSTTSIHRFNGSIAMDKSGNMAMGYTVSNDGVAPHPVVFPSVRYVGRLATDPAGEMTTPETTLVNGSASQPPDNPSDAFDGRWGDYASMRVDPVDGCTFWYTGEYVASTGTRSTRFASFSFPTCAPADMSVTKTGPATATAGTPISYTITAANNGTSDATNVVLQDTLPAGITFLSTSAVCTSGTVLTGCNIGPLASGANYSFTIQAQVPANFLSNLGLGTTNITNRVTVSADQFDPDNTNNTATATTTITESADVSVAKTCKPDTVVAQAGTNAFCSIVVTNNGPSFAQHVSLTDSIVGSTPFTIGTVTKTQGTCTSTSGASTSGTVTCNLGAIAAGGSATITVNFSANNGGSIDDTATVSASTPDPDTSNNTATGAVTFVSSADLLIVKTAAASVVPGTNLTYTISVANAGPSTATNVVVQDVLPVQVTMLSATPSVGSCTAGIPGNPGQPLTCTLGGMASGGSASITVVVKVAANTPNGTTISNNATVASDVGDPNNHNNSSTAYTTASTQADLSIVVTSDASTYKPSSIITYTVTVTNNGPSDAQAVVVTDNLPTFKQATYQSDTGGCTISSTVLTCVLGTMPVGTSKFFNIYELVNGNQGSVADTATVSSSNTDPSLANNTSIRTVTVGK